MSHTPRGPIAIAVALLVSAGTWGLGWWAVVPVAAVAGWYFRDAPRIAAWTAAGAVLGWMLLLALDALGGRLGALARVLSGTVALPTPALVVLTLAIPAILGWSAATLAGALGEWLGADPEDSSDSAAPPA